MVRVLFSCPMDAERRAVLGAVPKGTFDAVILEDLPEASREAAWSEAEVLVCSGFGSEIPPDLATRAPNLKMLQTLVAGVDHLPYSILPPSLIVCGNAGAYNTSIAEHAMALLLAAAKDLVTYTDEIRRGVFDQTRMEHPLEGATVVVAGMGGIGTEVARLCKAFRANVIGLTRSGRATPPADEGATLDDLPRIARRANVLVIALPLTKSTRGVVDADVLRAMPEDALLVNIARGKVLVEDDLFDHLKSHPRFRAALDVWWTYPRGKAGRPFHRPFHELPNVIMTPHIANAIPVQRRRATAAALDNVVRFVRGEEPRNRVDPSEYTGEPRYAE